MNYDVAQLPEIDAVEIVNLQDVLSNHINSFMQAAASAPCVRVTDETAQSIARLWRQLPFAEQMRCHAPPYGFRFYKDDNLILQASVCWGCNNIFIDMEGRALVYTFDAEHPYSRTLLSLAKHIME
ncbi:MULTISPECIES: hypothetical protein [Nostocales]|uniref:Uncharacterized protein n=3 Tax=Nostocales TaxID=1161 RepID=A0A0C1QP53_9CYAN|nr:hypothetical protein [Tolypothrix bouteillei]KAF3889242.1 hypothetical protein DA73_0400029990 [Tolypothrix bouteillei VB521301]